MIFDTRRVQHLVVERTLSVMSNPETEICNYEFVLYFMLSVERFDNNQEKIIFIILYFEC